MPSRMGKIVSQLSRLPASSPISSMISDSTSTINRILPGGMPSAWIRPISRVRSNTAISRVLIRPNDSARKMMQNQTIMKPSMTSSIEAM